MWGCGGREPPTSPYVRESSFIHVAGVGWCGLVWCGVVCVSVRVLYCFVIVNFKIVDLGKNYE